MSVGTQGAHSSINDINVTPMIDVLLVLLIIFMITQPLSRMTLKVQVPPPPQPTNSPPTNSNQIVLEMPDNGSYSINGQPVPKAQLYAQLHAIYDPRLMPPASPQAGGLRGTVTDRSGAWPRSTSNPERGDQPQRHPAH
jgi:biopolymer transport protein ExbD